VQALPGTGNPEHLAENVAAGATRFYGEELAVLNAIDESANQETLEVQDMGRTYDDGLSLILGMKQART